MARPTPRTSPKDELVDRLVDAMRDAGGNAGDKNRATLEDLALSCVDALDAVAEENPTLLMRGLGAEGRWFTDDGG